MEMIMISPRQLKVMMDASDMIKYELNSGGDEGRLCRREALRRILRKAKDATGFDSEGARVTVRMFPSRDGGCEMFVTLLGGEELEPENARTEVSSRVRDGMAVYSFASFGELINACGRLCDAGYSGVSLAYRRIDKARYYLALEGDEPLACEMGGTRTTRRAAAYINEYCALISERAVETLARFA